MIKLFAFLHQCGPYSAADLQLKSKHPRCDVIERFEVYALKYSDSHKNSCWKENQRKTNQQYKQAVFNTFDLGDITYNFITGHIKYNELDLGNPDLMVQTDEPKQSIEPKQNFICVNKQEISRNLRGCCSSHKGIQKCIDKDEVGCLDNQIVCGDHTTSKGCRCD